MFPVANPLGAGLWRTLGLGARRHPVFGGMGGESPFRRGARLQARGSPQGGGRECRSEKDAVNGTQPEEEPGVRGGPALQGEACLAQGLPRREGGKPAGTGPVPLPGPCLLPSQQHHVLSAASTYTVLTFTPPPSRGDVIATSAPCGLWRPRLGRATLCAAGCPSAPIEEEPFTLSSK